MAEINPLNLISSNGELGGFQGSWVIEGTLGVFMGQLGGRRGAA